MKRTSITLLLVTLLSMMGVKAYADFNTKISVQVGALYYYLDDENNTAQVARSREYRGKITIPSQIKYDNVQYSVTSIEPDAFHGCSGLTSITIPNSVTSIENGVFSDCSGLTSVTISNGVTSIGASAFEYCSSLTSIIIPNSVTSIENGVFSDCSGLTSVTIGNSVASIEYNAFMKCTGLTSITIPNSVTSIEYNAFMKCTGLTSITIPNSVTSIGVNAFYACSNLTSVILGNGVTYIERSPFVYCSRLKDVYCYADQVPNTNSDGNIFPETVFFSMKLHVPAASIEAYRNTKSWKVAFIVALTDDDPKPTGITNINNDVVNGERYYSLDGKRLAQPQRGLNIIRKSDGTTKKVVIK